MSKGKFFSGKIGIRATSNGDIGTLDGMKYSEIAALATETPDNASGEVEINETTGSSYREGEGSLIVVSKTTASSVFVVGFTPAEYKTFFEAYNQKDVDIFIYNDNGGIGFGSGVCVRNINISIGQQHKMGDVSKFELAFDSVYATNQSPNKIENFECSAPV